MIQATPEPATPPIDDLQTNAHAVCMVSRSFFSRAAIKPDVGCHRKLAPPRSREIVQKQFEEVAGWTPLDVGCEVFVATRSQKRKSSESLASPTASSSANATIKRRDSQTPATRSTEVQIKRRRLNLASNAESIAKESSQNHTKRKSITPSHTHVDDTITNGNKTKITAFEEVSDNEGYYTGSTAFPNSTISGQANDEDDLVTRLVVLQHQVPTHHLPDDGIGGAAREVEKDGVQNLVEEGSARQSGFLRERAQAGNKEPNNAYIYSLDDDPRSKAEDTQGQRPETSFSLRGTLDSISNTPLYRPISHRRRPGLLVSRATTPFQRTAHRRSPPSSFRCNSSSHRLHTSLKRWRRSASASDINHLFDLARRKDEPPTPETRPSKRVHFGDEESLHPASRRAAERWCTQNRHSEYDTRRAQATTTLDQEARLRGIQNGRSKIVSAPDPTSEIYPDAFPRRTDLSATTIDQPHEPVPNPRNEAREPSSATHNGPREPVSTIANALYKPASAADNYSHEPAATPDEPTPTDTRPSAIAGLLAEKRKEEKQQVVHVSLGELADIDINDEGAFKAERRRLRELSSDLKLIQETYLDMARVLSHRNFDEPEARLLEDARSFVTRVVGKQLSGKTTKRIMVRARDTFKRRSHAKLEYLETPEATLDTAYRDLLGNSRAYQVKEALDKVERSLADLEEAFETNKQKIKDQKKAHRLQENENAQKIRSAERILREGRVQKPRSSKLNKTERDLARNRCLLGQYEAQRDTLQNQVPQQQNDREDAESVISEEDEDGTGFVQGGYTSVPRIGMMARPAYDGDDGPIIEEHQDMDEITILEEARQQEQQVPRPSSGQLFDEKLMLENQLAAVKRREVAENEVQFDDLDAGTDSDDGEEDDDDDDDATNSDLDDESANQVFQYEIRGVFYGLNDLYRDADEYGLGKFYYQTNAQAKLQKIITQLGNKYATKYGFFKLSASLTSQGVVEQKLKADNGSFYARLWIHKDLIDLSKVQARLVQKMAVIDTGATWYVDWEKTVITTTTTPAGASISNITNDHGDEDDLFGSSTREPDKVETTIRVERPGIAEVKLFTTSGFANKCAKNMYMAWFAEFAPAHERPSIMYPDYYGQLRLVHDRLQDEVEGALDGVGAGPWEEELERKPFDLDLDGQAGKGVKMSVKEKFRVVVRSVRVKGPGTEDVGGSVVSAKRRMQWIVEVEARIEER